MRWGSRSMLLAFVVCPSPFSLLACSRWPRLAQQAHRLENGLLSSPPVAFCDALARLAVFSIARALVPGFGCGPGDGPSLIESFVDERGGVLRRFSGDGRSSRARLDVSTYSFFRLHPVLQLVHCPPNWFGGLCFFFFSEVEERGPALLFKTFHLCFFPFPSGNLATLLASKVDSSVRLIVLHREHGFFPAALRALLVCKFAKKSTT
ncbi:unnamed protein product [Hapterophycus canaliculatus]